MRKVRQSLNALIFSFLILALFAGAALAQGPGGPGGFPGRPGGFPGHLYGLLDLTDEQKAQIKTLREQARTASESNFEKLRPLLEQSRSLTEAATFDEASFRNLATQIAQIQIELQIINARSDSAIYNLLTAEQKAKLAELRTSGPRRGQGDSPRRPR